MTLTLEGGAGAIATGWEVEEVAIMVMGSKMQKCLFFLRFVCGMEMTNSAQASSKVRSKILLNRLRISIDTKL